jgi:long-chain acyl-CoA synthetase
VEDKERLARLTAPGGAFPLTRRPVGATMLEVFDREPRTLREAFIATERHGDREALVYLDERYTYADQWHAVVGLAHRMRDQLGVGKGDRVAIAMRNYPEFVFVFWASQLIGAVVVPLNAWLKSAEMVELIDDVTPSALFADNERIELLKSVDLAAHGIEHVIAVRSDGAGKTYQALVADLPPHQDVPDCVVEPDDVATVLFTSGTTGRPKGAVGTHLNHSSSLLNKLIRSVGVSESEGELVVTMPPVSTRIMTFPFFHIAGINNLYSAAYPGHRIILMHKWNAQEALRLIEAERANEMAGPPFVVQTFLDAAATTGRDLTSLKSLGMGGSSAPVALIEQVDRLFEGAVSPKTGYGLTETTSGVVAIGGRDWVARPSSIGRPLPTAEVAILGDDGARLGTGEVGELIVRGPQVITRYYGRDSADSFVDGWFRTGDRARIDEDGYVHLVGRLKDIVIRGGENINAAEVEGCLSDHGDVLEVAVFGVPHPALGEELASIVHLRESSSVDGAALRQFVAERLASFKTPTKIAISPVPLPRTSSGKLLKRDIADAMDFDSLLASPGSYIHT